MTKTINKIENDIHGQPLCDFSNEELRSFLQHNELLSTSALALICSELFKRLLEQEE